MELNILVFGVFFVLGFLVVWAFITSRRQRQILSLLQPEESKEIICYEGDDCTTCKHLQECLEN